MVKRLLRGIRYFDWYLIINIILLVFFGLAALYSLQLNIEDPDFTLLKRQITFVIFGLGIFFLFSNINYQFWSDYYKIFMVLSACLLAGVLLVGQTLGGTQGWFEFFGQNLQPVEFVKIALVIFLARYYPPYIYYRFNQPIFNRPGDLAAGLRFGHDFVGDLAVNHFFIAYSKKIFH